MFQNEVARTAAKLSRNPLGIIALFIVLVYGLACLVLGISADRLDVIDRRILVVFIATFPVIVLGMFGWLVARHANKLYGPLDYKTDESFANVIGMSAAVSTHLVAAESARTGHAGEPEIDVEEIADLVAIAVPNQSRLTPSRKRILWIDDRPQNNIQLRRALEESGLLVQTEVSTERAQGSLRDEKFDLIISDMSRAEDSAAGYRLLETLRAAGNRVPYIIYTAQSSNQERIEAEQRGAQGHTSSPSELFRTVLELLR